jgi:hypothetical protein
MRGILLCTATAFALAAHALDGELVIALNDARQSVIDDGVSKRLTLRKGRNVIRAALINGGGPHNPIILP